ncbi:hypothetical protein ACOMHN_058353 [Nucella lapillus]
MERLTEFVNKSFEGSNEPVCVSKPPGHRDRDLFLKNPEPGTSYSDVVNDDDDDDVDDESVDVCDIKEEDVTVDDDERDHTNAFDGREDLKAGDY